MPMDCKQPPPAEPLPKLVEDELAGSSTLIASVAFVQNPEPAWPAGMLSSSTSDGNRRAPVVFQQTASKWGPPVLDDSTLLTDSNRKSTAPLASRMAPTTHMSGHPRRQTEDGELVQLADRVSSLATHKLLPAKPSSGDDWERQHTAPLPAKREDIICEGTPAEEPGLDPLRDRRPVRSLSLPLRPRLHVHFQGTGNDSEPYTLATAGRVTSHSIHQALPRHTFPTASPGEQGVSKHDDEEENGQEDEEGEAAEGDDEAEEGPRTKLRRLASLNGGSGSWQLKRAQLLGSLTGSPRGNPTHTLK